MPPETIQFPLSATILLILATLLLGLILAVLLRLNTNIRILTQILSKTSRISKTHSESEANEAIVKAGSHFDTFLKENPECRSLTKKDQFKAYRKWRGDKGLNWSR